MGYLVEFMGHPVYLVGVAAVSRPIEVGGE
jgi:hypothetical protein